MKQGDIDRLIQDSSENLRREIDNKLLFDILTEDWHKMEITFGKDRYHEHRDMEAWCLEYIGDGGWTYGSPKDWRGLDGRVWVMHSMFGNTTFAFKEPKHYTMFVLRWS